MTSFGKRAVRPGDKGLTSSVARPGVPGAPGVDIKQESESFRRMKEEEAEREQWAKEADERKGERSASKKRSPPPARRKGPNPRVFFEIEIRGKLNGKLEASGRVEFELFADSVPKTAENVRCLCTGERGKNLHYENSTFHRIVPGLLAQGGDITFGDGGGADGGGCGSGRSIYGDTFADEGLTRRHERRGVLSMANTGPNTNNSQFMIMFAAAPQLNGKHVVVGEMTKEEDDILRRVEACGSRSGRVHSMVSIVRCGELGAAGRPRAASRSRSRGRGARPAWGRDARGREDARGRGARY